MDSNQFDFLVNKLCRLEHSLAEITNIKTRLDAIEGQRTGPQWPRPYSEVTRSNIVRSLLPAPPAREPGPIPRVQPLLPAPPALGPVSAPRVRPLLTNLNTDSRRGIPPRAAEAATTDRLTIQVSHDLFISCQLRHHERNWKQLPKNLSGQLDIIFNSIVPPRPTPDFKVALDKLRNECKGGLTALVLQHIQERGEEVRNRLLSKDLVEIVKVGEGGRRKFDTAASMARKRLMENYGRKIKEWEIGRWLEDADKMIERTIRERRNEEETNRDKQTNNATRGVEFTSDSIQPKERQSKRRASDTGSSPILVSNRYSVLGNRADEDSSAEELGTRTTETSKKKLNKKRRSKRPRRTSDVERDTDEELINVANALLHENSMYTDEETATVAEPPIRSGTIDKEEQEDEVNGIRDIQNRTQGIIIEPPEIQDRTNLISSADNSRDVNLLALDKDIDGAMNRPSISTAGTSEDIPYVRISERTTTQKRLTSSQPTNTGSAGLVTVHDGPKHDWRAEVRRNTEVLIIADSNMRTVSGLPSNWEVQVFPGASLGHASQIIRKLQEPVNIKSIVVSMGINSRDWTQDLIEKHISAIGSASSVKKIRCHFIGVSIPSELKPSERSTLAFLNKKAQEKFKGDYIQPLNSSTVSVSPTDIYGIHYTQSTVDRIIEKIKNHFLLPSPLNRHLRSSR